MRLKLIKLVNFNNLNYIQHVTEAKHTKFCFDEVLAASRDTINMLMKTHIIFHEFFITRNEINVFFRFSQRYLGFISIRKRIENLIPTFTSYVEIVEYFSATYH